MISTFYEHIAEAAIQEHKSVGEICKIVRAAGIEAVEMDAARLIPHKLTDKHRIAVLKKELKEADLKISCIYQFFNFGYENKTEPGFELVDLAKECGAGFIMPIPGFMTKGEMPGTAAYQDCFHKMVSCLSLIMEYAKKEGIQVVLEDFDDAKSPIATSKGLLEFKKALPELQFAFDTGNFIYSGEDVSKAFELLKGSIAHVHLKDRGLLVPGQEPVNGYEEVICTDGRRICGAPTGYGDLPIREIITELLSSGYQGYFAAEHFGSAHQLQDLCMSAEWIKNTILQRN